uniref:Uridine kinase n=1 Tax=Romanomermis culicivorax TaxID=13658 RepID=A0A915L9B0_ROMCU
GILQVVYTAGRPPWYDCHGTQSKEPFFIGICGGSASGKTTVARSIIESLDVPWVTLLNMDSFYKILTHEQHEAAVANNYNFDHPSAFDFEMLVKTLKRLKLGKRVEVPIYNFTTHSREKSCKTMYGASVLILEGILTFHNKEILEMMDLKIFVDADSDTRLARRLSRDITERGRDVDGVLKQVEKFVKPSFDNFIAPSMQNADIIIPRGGDNYVAIDLIARHIQSRLQIDAINGNGGSTCRALLASAGACNGKLTNGCYTAPPTLHLLKQTPQLKVMKRCLLLRVIIS